SQASHTCPVNTTTQNQKNIVQKQKYFKYIGTLLSSQTTTTHPSNQPTTKKGKAAKSSEKGFANRMFSSRQHFTKHKGEGALSVAATHIKLHTTNQQHKLPGHRPKIDEL
ncbi:hypothetical protein NQ015_10120, partial [Corynebacterium sp. 153RC1]|uniref:hypothetical protein n=1 Tax=unclassified Corynebacterium TaxID=2624378 RepID=UPI00211BB70E